MNAQIGLVDDHQLFLKSVSLMIESFGHFDVVIEALNGQDLQEKMKKHSQRVPDIILIDVNMPIMDGIETASWLNAQYPAMKLAALSMNDKDQSIIKMFKAGCCSYLLKDIHPAELEKALIQINEKGHYNSDVTNINFRRLLLQEDEKPDIILTANEAQFLKFACSELTYKQVASEMNLSERTIDGYREALFQKFHVQSRVGLCLEALRKKFVTL